MKKGFTKICPTLKILLIAAAIFIPFHVQADVTSLITGFATSGINSFLANLGNTLLSFTGYMLSVVGVFLNFSIITTLRIGEYAGSMVAIREVWIVIRNISSIFIIFLLMFSSISTILGVGKSKLYDLIKNIIIAGLLINFSLFFVKIGIDASNLVSMQFYRAMAPNTQDNVTVGKAFTAGGISDVFMSSLRIPQIYQNTSTLKSADVGLSIFIATMAGIIMMVTAGFSFLAAAIAFMARTGILLFIMALSPFYFAGMIFPQLKKDVSEPLLKYFTNQLIFMPVYLGLMYIALRLISSPGFKAVFNQSATGMIPSGEGPLGATSIAVIIQYTIAIIFINAPLIAAIQFGAKGAKWAPGLGIAKWANDKVGFPSMWRNTGSRVASRVAESKSFQQFAGKSDLGEQLLKGTRSVAKDYNTRLDKRLSEREATYKSLSDDTAKANYAGRLAGSLLGKTGRMSMGMTGRADRVGAAKILTTREKEIKEEINKLQNRRDELERVMAGTTKKAGRPLTPVEQVEYDKIIDPADPAKGSLPDENKDLTAIQAQIAQFKVASGGLSPKDVSKRKY